jgi:hypothetical protein
MKNLNNPESNVDVTDHHVNRAALHDENPKYAWIFITILAIVLLFALVWSLANDDTDVVIIDDSPEVLIDDGVTVATTDSVIDGINARSTNFDRRNDIENQSAYVGAVYSDRFFQIFLEGSSQGQIAYLGDVLDLGVAEDIIEIDAGDTIIFDGYIASISTIQITSEERTTLVGVTEVIYVTSLNLN